MIAASPALVRYIRRAELPTRTSCDQFIAGVASYLAVMSWLDWQENGLKKTLQSGCEILELADIPNREAVWQAYFFAGAVTAKDPHYGSRVFSLAVVLAGAWKSMWPQADPDGWIAGTWAAELGWTLAAEADGSGTGWEDDDNPSHGLNYPDIEAVDAQYFQNGLAQDIYEDRDNQIT